MEKSVQVDSENRNRSYYIATNYVIVRGVTAIKVTFKKFPKDIERKPFATIRVIV